MEGHVRAAPALTDEGQLYILDDEGVFFSRTRGELFVFNTAATFLWCGIEAGWSRQGLVDACVEAWQFPPEDVRRRVAQLLREWWALGYLDSPGGADAGDVDPDTALAWMLGNPRLRAAFRAAPETLARDLGVRDGHRRAFLALAADALDRQAALIDRAREPQADAARSELPHVVATADGSWSTLIEAVARARVKHLGETPPFRRYRLLSTTFGVRYASGAQVAQIDPALNSLATDAVDDADVLLDVVDTEAGHVLVEGRVPVAFCTSIDRMAPVLKSLLRLRALARHDFLMEIHAGVVALDGQCLLLPGPPGSGKSTLTAGLCHAGFTYFSDEVALLEDDLRLRPVPLGVGIKPGAVAALSALWPVVPSLTPHDREDGQRVRYLTLPAEHCATADARLPARWIVFPTYDADVQTELRPISRGEALRRLMNECMVLPRGLDDDGVERLVRWMRSTECCELPMRSLEEAVDLLRQLCRAE